MPIIPRNDDMNVRTTGTPGEAERRLPGNNAAADVVQQAGATLMEIKLDADARAAELYNSESVLRWTAEAQGQLSAFRKKLGGATVGEGVAATKTVETVTQDIMAKAHPMSRAWLNEKLGTLGQAFEADVQKHEYEQTQAWQAETVKKNGELFIQGVTADASEAANKSPEEIVASALQRHDVFWASIPSDQIESMTNKATGESLEESNKKKQISAALTAAIANMVDAQPGKALDLFKEAGDLLTPTDKAELIPTLTEAADKNDANAELRTILHKVDPSLFEVLNNGKRGAFKVGSNISVDAQQAVFDAIANADNDAYADTLREEWRQFVADNEVIRLQRSQAGMAVVQANADQGKLTSPEVVESYPFSAAERVVVDNFQTAVRSENDLWTFINSFERMSTDEMLNANGDPVIGIDILMGKIEKMAFLDPADATHARARYDAAVRRARAERDAEADARLKATKKPDEADDDTVERTANNFIYAQSPHGDATGQIAGWQSEMRNIWRVADTPLGTKASAEERDKKAMAQLRRDNILTGVKRAMDSHLATFPNTDPATLEAIGRRVLLEGATTLVSTPGNGAYEGWEIAQRGVSTSWVWGLFDTTKQVDVIGSGRDYALAYGSRPDGTIIKQARTPGNKAKRVDGSLASYEGMPTERLMFFSKGSFDHRKVDPRLFDIIEGNGEDLTGYDEAARQMGMTAEDAEVIKLELANSVAGFPSLAFGTKIPWDHPTKGVNAYPVGEVVDQIRIAWVEKGGITIDPGWDAIADERGLTGATRAAAGAVYTVQKYFGFNIQDGIGVEPTFPAIESISLRGGDLQELAFMGLLEGHFDPATPEELARYAPGTQPVEVLLNEIRRSSNIALSQSAPEGSPATAKYASAPETMQAIRNAAAFYKGLLDQGMDGDRALALLQNNISFALPSDAYDDEFFFPEDWTSAKTGGE